MSRPEYFSENRFAVVMYGGVSLAIYINGVAQELYRLVSATANGPDEPAGSEQVYKKIAGKLKTRFVVDILSGTSAGGINGIFLAKALANGQSIKSLEQMWLDEGDINVLINDKKSKDKGISTDFENPKSLLNSERMYKKLLEKLNVMDQETLQNRTQNASFVPELDLYVTATDLQGLPIPLRLADQVVFEKKHQNMFHFHFKKADTGDNDNDFKQENNPFLAFAARCTSSFPFAFEPMRFEDISTEIKHDEWNNFYARYLLDPALLALFKEDPPPNPRKTKDGKYDVFSQRAFADGGYLDNKPFSYAINAITSRSSDIPVDRKLIYIEPSPEDTPKAFPLKDPPNAIENVSKVFSLALYETIQQDLQRIIDRNRLIERVNRILTGTREDIFINDLNPSSVEQWQEAYLNKMIAQEGIAYGGYLRLRVAQLTDDLTYMITRQAGFDVESDYFLAVRYIVRAWRDLRYDYYIDEGVKNKKENFNQFLKEYDLSFNIRRLNYTISNIDSIFPLIDFLSQEKDQTEPIKEDKILFEDRLRQAQKELSERFGQEIALIESEVDLIAFRDRLLRIRKQLSCRRESIYDLRAKLQKPYSDNEITQAVRNMQINDAGKLKEEILSKPSESASYKAAQDFVKEKGRDQSFQKVAEIISNSAMEANKHSDLCKVELGLGELFKDGTNETTNNNLAKDLEVLLQQKKLVEANQIKLKRIPLAEKHPAQPADLATWLAASLFRRFLPYDLVAYPILQFSGAGEELDPVEIIRISPNDATALSDEGVHKLGGTALMHFGAFLDRTWRKNDILWGRLDGAERIITALLSGTPYQRETSDYVKEAHLAILEETFLTDGLSRPQETMDLLVELVLGKTERDRKNNTGKVSKGLDEDAHQAVSRIIKEMLNNKLDAQQIYNLLKGYEVNQDIDPKVAMESIARSTQVIGKMLGVISDQYRLNPLKRVAKWIARLGQFAWGLVEAAVPKTFFDLITKKWISLILLISVILFAGGAFIKDGGLQRFGVFLFLASAGFTLMKFLIRSVILEKKKTVQWVVRLIIGLCTGAILLLAAIGVYYFPTVWRKVIGLLLH